MCARLLLIALVISCFLTGCSKTTEANTQSVSTPIFSVVSGIYTRPLIVAISCPTVGAEIRFTLDGTVPSIDSAEYDDPIYVFTSLTIRAAAFKSGCTPSSVATASYSIFPDMGRIITNISATPNTIYADNGLTWSTIRTTVKDGYGFAVVGQLVRFSTNLGHIVTNVVTDEAGEATTTLWGENYSGVAQVRALAQYYHPDYPDFLVSSDSALVFVTISKIPPISKLTLQLPTTQDPFPMDINQSIQVRARARNILGNYVADGTLIAFSTTVGFFADEQGNSLGTEIDVPTLNGYATTTFNAGTYSGSGLLTVHIANFTASRNILVVP